ncbi:MAG: DUF3095 domain-containing protein, partial [Proteobacteria bacterium]|nr:DUF3095 domain-containing protein [Pseudomonadota bacterium]
DVNFAAAAMISALSNLAGSIPYQFGGDGAVVLIPPDFADEARKVLARTRTFAKREFRLDLRVGFVPVRALSERKCQVLVGRYEPSPGNAYAVFQGSGVEDLEQAVKGRSADASLTDLAMVRDDEDDGEPPDLTGLSCRWQPLQSKRGKMVSLVIRGGDHGELHMSLHKLTGVESLKAASLGALVNKWPAKGIVREAKALHGRRPVALLVTWIALKSLFLSAFYKFDWSLGPWLPSRYKREITENAVDFARSGAVLALVFDCPSDRIDIVRAFMDERQARGELQYGMHISDHAVMTCFVTSPAQNEHVHFIDGGDGGYTKAATHLKAQLRAASAA